MLGVDDGGDLRAGIGKGIEGVGDKDLLGVRQLWAWGIWCEDSSHTITGVWILLDKSALVTVSSSFLDWPMGDLDLAIRRGCSISRGCCLCSPATGTAGEAWVGRLTHATEEKILVS